MKGRRGRYMTSSGVVGMESSNGLYAGEYRL